MSEWVFALLCVAALVSTWLFVAVERRRLARAARGRRWPNR